MMATSETGSLHDQSGSCFVDESIFSFIGKPAEDKSPEVSDEEHMLAMVHND